MHGTGLDGNGQAIRKRFEVSEAEWAKATETLTRLAELGEKHNKMFMLENLNLLVDHPGTPFGLANRSRPNYTQDVDGTTLI